MVPNSAHRGQEHADEGMNHHETDVQETSDPEEDQTGDEAVREHERINRLEEIDLEDKHQIGRVLDCVRRRPGLRFDEKRSETAVDLKRIEEHDGRIDGRHPQAHGNHEKGFQRPAFSEIYQKHSQEYQPETREGYSRIGREHRADALEQTRKFF